MRSFLSSIFVFLLLSGCVGDRSGIRPIRNFVLASYNEEALRANESNLNPFNIRDFEDTIFDSSFFSFTDPCIVEEDKHFFYESNKEKGEWFYKADGGGTSLTVRRLTPSSKGNYRLQAEVYGSTRPPARYRVMNFYVYERTESGWVNIDQWETRSKIEMSKNMAKMLKEIEKTSGKKGPRF
jgi:hypothetical protein